MKLIKRFILNRPAEKRLAYFYGMVATDEQVWLLRDKNGDLLFLEDDGDYLFLLPVWPSRSFAEMEAAHLDESYEAFNIPLSIFLDKLLVDILKMTVVPQRFSQMKTIHPFKNVMK
jgi:Protein of unknown function (DUF2750)